MRVWPVDAFEDEDQARWISLLLDGFVNLAATGGLCGIAKDPLAEIFRGDTTLSHNDECIELRCDFMDVDSGAILLLLNLCEWGANSISDIELVEIHAPFALPHDASLPGRSRFLSLAVDEAPRVVESLEIDCEFTRDLSGGVIQQVSHLMIPWQTALFRGGFASPNLPHADSLVIPDQPPIVIVRDLWSWRYTTFLAADHAVDVFLNCLERVHRSVARVSMVHVD